MNEATHVISAFVGIDVSKRKLDCAVLIDGKIKSKVVSNDRSGFALLNAWLQERSAAIDSTHLCMEATGPYSEQAALALVELFTSVAKLAELTDILGRRKFEKKIAASMLSVDQLVGRYAELAQVVRPMPTPRIVSDPDDDVVIGTALAAKADLLVTGNRGLLNVREYQGVRIISVTEALGIVIPG